MIAIPSLSTRVKRGLITPLLLLFALQAGADTLTVGATGSGCNHLTIQAAVNEAQNLTGADTIRISRSAEWTAQAINITTNDELTIVGGYATCDSANPDGIATEISGDGGAAAAVMTIRGNGTVFLRELIIKEGDNPNGQGGGIDWRSGGILDIRDSEIVNNLAGYGGGIYAQGSSTVSEVVVGENVTIGFNQARFNGGGVLAGGLEFSVLGNNTSILFNEALGVSGDTGYGGGALVVSTDDLSSYLYISAGGIGGLGAIYGNNAKNGGGVAVIGGEETGHEANLLVFSTQSATPVLINGNVASSRGGAIYLKSDTDVTSGDAYATAQLWHMALVDNSAPDGAAAYLDFDDVSFLSFDWPSWMYINSDLPPPAGAPCPVDQPCGYITGNTTGNNTGAIIRLPRSTFHASRVQFSDNVGGRLFYLTNSGGQFEGSDLVLDNSLIANNTVAQDLIRMDDDRDDANFLDMRHVTITDNVIGAPQVLYAQGFLRFKNSLVAQPEKMTLAASSGNRDIEYVLTNDTINMSGAFFLANPRFIDPSNDDYRLRAGSYAVDFAPAKGGVDLGGRPHTIDMPIGGILGRTADVGAYERPALQPLVLNADFDTNLNLWDGLSDSFWDGSQNVSGIAGSGSVRIPLIISPEGIGNSPTAAGRSQCIHLPGPGIYTLNGYGRVVPSSNPPLTSNRARLLWELRYNGGASGCEEGSISQSGTLNLASSSAWESSPTPAQIVIPTVSWTINTSLTVKLDVIGSAINPPDAWFDAIRVNTSTDTIFKDGFD